MNSPNERIQFVAIKLRNGRIITTSWGLHIHCFIEAYPDGDYPDDIVVGFTTTSGRFVDREEAGVIARAYIPALHPLSHRPLEAMDWREASSASYRCPACNRPVTPYNVRCTHCAAPLNKSNYEIQFTATTVAPAVLAARPARQRVCRPIPSYRAVEIGNKSASSA